MAAHVVSAISSEIPLKAEIMHQPVEQRSAIVPVNCDTQSLVAKLTEQVEGASKTANLINQANRMIKRRRIDSECRRL